MTIEEIKQSQIDNKISDKELCAMANVSVATFWRYKNGKTEISVSKLKRLETAISEIKVIRLKTETLEQNGILIRAK